MERQGRARNVTPIPEGRALAAPVWLEGRRRGAAPSTAQPGGRRIGPALRLLTAVGLVALVGALDYLSGWAMAFAVFYLLPVAFATWRVDGRAGLLVAALCTAVWWAVDYATSPLAIGPVISTWNALTRLGIFALLSVTLDRLRSALRANQDLALMDQLTGLPNGRAFFAQATDHIAAARREGDEVTVAFLDLDDFKEINMRLGHTGADRLLQSWGEVLRGAVRAHDAIARLGGDEFAILFVHAPGEEAGAVVAGLRERLVTRAAELEWPLTFSLGAVTFARPPASIDALLFEADLLMYAVKDSGKRGWRHERRDRDASGESPGGSA